MTTAALLFRLAWVLWGASWVAASLWSARSVKRALGGTALSRIVTIAGAVVLFGGAAVPIGGVLWSVGDIGLVILGLVMLAGFSFAWWARLHLGRFWSSGITRKEGHRLVDTGPYGLVRHPIYTGLIGAVVATSIEEATLVAMIGGTVMAFGLWLKATLEERFLREEFGPAVYDTYRQRVPMLVPFLPTPS